MKNKSYAAARLVIYSIVAITLAAVLVWGISTGDKSSFFSFIPGFSVFTSEDLDTYDLGNGGEFYGKDINSINISWPSGTVTLKPSDSDKITLSESSSETLDGDEQMICKLEGTTLKVRYSRQKLTSLNDANKKDLVVVLPDYLYSEITLNCVSADTEINGIRCNKLDIDSVSGKVFLDKVSTDSIKLDCVSGSFSAIDTTTENLDFNSASGDMDFEGTVVNKLSADTVSAEITARLSLCPNSVDTTSVSGDVTLYLPENSGFSADLDTISGRFSSDFSTTNNGDDYVCGDGSSDFDFDSTSGDFNIKILKGIIENIEASTAA